jgi:predicted transcriptional regulator
LFDRAPVRLGFLEKEVLEWLWSQSWSDVRKTHAALGQPRLLSRNTIHSTLERLVRKSLVERERRGRAYVYRACVLRENFVREAVSQTLESIPGADASLLLASFVDVAERVDDTGLAELERLVRIRRRSTEPEEEERDAGGEER